MDYAILFEAPLVIRTAREWLFGSSLSSAHAAARTAADDTIDEARAVVREIETLQTANNPLHDLVRRMIDAKRVANGQPAKHLARISRH